MRIPFILFVFFIGLWLLLALLLVGLIPLSGNMAGQVMALDLPKNTAELGESLTILDGLFSSIAIVLGLMAILLQGRELKAQMQLQTESNRLAAYTARLTFLSQEVARLGNDISRLAEELKTITDKEKKEEKQRIFENSVNKRKKYMEKMEKIDNEVEDMLSKLGMQDK